MDKRQKYIDFILDTLRSGVYSYTDVFKLAVSKFKFSEPTFARYWKEAKPLYHKEREMIDKVKTSNMIQAEVSELRANILSKMEALEILTKIAKGVSRKVGNHILTPSDAERRASIETIAKIEGWNSPDKMESTNSIEFIETVVSKKI